MFIENLIKMGNSNTEKISTITALKKFSPIDFYEFKGDKLYRPTAGAGSRIPIYHIVNAPTKANEIGLNEVNAIINNSTLVGLRELNKQGITFTLEMGSEHRTINPHRSNIVEFVLYKEINRKFEPVALYRNFYRSDGFREEVR